MKYLKTFENLKNPDVIPKYWYHGTNQDFDKFDLNYMKTNFESSILGIYFTQYLKPPPYGSSAIEYAKNAVSISGGVPIIYKCEVKLDNPLYVDSKGWYSSNALIDIKKERFLYELENHNYDGIIIYNSEDYKLPDYITDIEVINKYRKDNIEYMDFILATREIEKIKIIEKIKL